MIPFKRWSLLASGVLGATWIAVAACSTSSETPRANGGTNTSTHTSTATGTNGGKELTLSWDPYQGGQVQRYNVYIATPQNGQTQLLGNVDPTKNGFNAGSPSATFSSQQNQVLKGYVGGEACLSITAVVAGVESSPSLADCVSL